MRRVATLLLWAALAATALAQTLSGRVVGVTDGDTITVLIDRKAVKVRLHGIDAPETGQPYSAAAKKRLSDLVFGREVQIERRDRDRYGRTVATVLCRDRNYLYTTIARGNVNHILVWEGLAWWYRRYAPGDRELRRLEDGAKRAKRGLWAEPGAIAPWEWRSGRRASAGSSPAVRSVVQVEATVYVTRTGTKYHVAGCRYLRSSSIPMARAEAEKAYDACSVCGGLP